MTDTHNKARELAGEGLALSKHAEECDGCAVDYKRHAGTHYATLCRAYLDLERKMREVKDRCDEMCRTPLETVKQHGEATFALEILEILK